MSRRERLAAQLPLFEAYQDWPRNDHCADCAVWISGVFVQLAQGGVVRTDTIPPPPHGGWPESAEAQATVARLERLVALPSPPTTEPLR